MIHVIRTLKFQINLARQTSTWKQMVFPVFFLRFLNAVFGVCGTVHANRVQRPKTDLIDIPVGIFLPDVTRITSVFPVSYFPSLFFSVCFRGFSPNNGLCYCFGMALSCQLRGSVGENFAQVFCASN